MAPILLVDDDAKNLLVLEAILNAPDYLIFKASNADQTLMVLMQQDCAAIVMDVRMPDMNGIELAQLIKQRKKTRHIPILFLTAHPEEEENIILGYDVGAVDYITKPVNPAILRSKIGVFADLYRKTADLARLNSAMELEIQDRKKAEERFRLVVEAAPHAKIVVDHLGCIALVNTQTEMLFGYTRDELLGRPLTILIPQSLPSIVRTAQALPHSRYELTGVRKDGRVVPLEVGLGQFQTAEGMFGLASLVDISRRKETEAALLSSNQELALKNKELERSADERARRMIAEAARAEAEAANSAKDRFLAMLSHELRTPLSPVLHSVALLEEEKTSPRVRDLLETIRRNVQLEARLIDDLLDLARIRNGKLTLHLESADVHDLISRAVQICEPDIRKHQLNLQTELHAKRTRLRADSARILQIFWNLINNAIKFTPEGGSITLTTADEESGGRVIVQFQDTGIGIRPDHLHRIFDAFEQAHDEQPVGLGLGLAICRVLAELHGGSIRASSSGPDQGSLFTVTLPATAGRSAAARPKLKPSAPAKAGLRILMVEDHRDTASNLSALLTRRGHEVAAAANIAEALKKMQQDAFDVLLSDIGLPDGRGTDLMKPFVEAAGARPVAGIALSGYGMPEDIRRSIDAGFTHHLIKPVEIAGLQTVLLEISGRLAPDAETPVEAACPEP